MSNRYRDLLFRLFPSGRAFPVFPTSGVSRLLGALALELQRIENRAKLLISEADPRTALETLDRWETVLNVTRSGTDTERQTRITGKFSRYGGQTRQYIIDTLMAAGITINIVEYPGFEPSAVLGQNLTDTQKKYCFRADIYGGDNSVVRLTIGMQCGQPLAKMRVNSPAPAIIDAIKPAHTFAFYVHS